MATRVAPRIHHTPPPAPISHTKKSSEILTENGKRYQVTKEEKIHGFCWRVCQFVIALAKTLFTAIIGLFFLSCIRENWKNACSGKEITLTKTELPPVVECAWNAPPLRLDKFVKNPKEDFHKTYLSIARANRHRVREETAERMLSALVKADDPRNPPTRLKAVNSCANAASPDLSKACLFSSSLSSGAFGPRHLLGRFDVAVAPCKMDYDPHWRPHHLPQSPFVVCHAAALNIGEVTHAGHGASPEDFAEYSVDGKLNKAKYVHDMGKIFSHILYAQSRCAKHAVWFPLGMGAFLRGLSSSDPAYADPNTIWELRKELAEEFFKQAARFTSLQLHLCLPMEENAPGSATNQNYNAFARALLNTDPETQKRVQVYINVDATNRAQRLANEHGEFTVALTNGANRNLLGNRWYQDGAETAIDENVHRRSWHLAAVSYLLNGGVLDPQDRGPRELEERIWRITGNSPEAIPASF